MRNIILFVKLTCHKVSEFIKSSNSLNSENTFTEISNLTKTFLGTLICLVVHAFYCGHLKAAKHKPDVTIHTHVDYLLFPNRESRTSERPTIVKDKLANPLVLLHVYNVLALLAAL